MATPLLPQLTSLPATLPIEGAVRIEIEESIPVFLSLKQSALARQDFLAAVTEFQRQGNEWGYQQAIEGLRSASAP